MFLLLAAGIASAWYVRRHEHLLLPWRRVARSATAMVSLLVLSLFLVVGLLDTLHYRVALPEQNNGETVYSPEVLSVFDKLVEPLRTHIEKTYSAPLAVTLYAKESTADAQGNVVRDYPRLQYGGAHLTDVSQRDGDVVQRALIGALAGLLVGLLIVHSVARAAEQLPSIGTAARGGWRPVSAPISSAFAVITALIIAALIGALANLAAAYHVLGTDKVGQDVLYLSLKSIRTGLIIGTVTTLVTLPLALFLGIAAGYLRGWVDDVIQYVYTVLSSIPSVLLIAAAVLMMQVTIDTHPEWFDTTASRADLRLVFLCLILGVTSWTGLCRLLRGETLKLREMEYIQAAQSFGVSTTAHPDTPHRAERDAHHPDRAGDGFLGTGAGRGGAVLRRCRCRSFDDQLRHDDQRGAAGDGARADGVVGAGRRLCFHAGAGAGGEPVRRRGARCVRSAFEPDRVAVALLRNFELRIPHDLPQMLVGILKVARITAPESVLCRLHDHRARVAGLRHHGIHFCF